MSIENQNFTNEKSDFNNEKSLLQMNLSKSIHQAISTFEENNNAADSTAESPFKSGLKKTTNRLIGLAPELKEDLDNLTTLILEQEVEEKKQFCDFAAEQLTSFLLARFSLTELEGLSRKDRLMLNRLVEYHISEDVVDIHIPLTFHNGLELKALFVDAMKVLANKFVNDLDFEKVQRVEANSWIIWKSSDETLQRLGFTNIKRDEKKQTGQAEITKETLLQKYG